ncbi:MAG: hypothetical protein KF690_09825 [Bacteroidetes bacterium]|nr:hypothetical protein [Bacteroidota bacterium]
MQAFADTLAGLACIAREDDPLCPDSEPAEDLCENECCRVQPLEEDWEPYAAVFNVLYADVQPGGQYGGLEEATSESTGEVDLTGDPYSLYNTTDNLLCADWTTPWNPYSAPGAEWSGDDHRYLVVPGPVIRKYSTGPGDEDERSVLQRLYDAYVADFPVADEARIPAYWRAEYALLHVHKHPEYNYYRFEVDFRSAYAYQAALEATDAYDDANCLGHLSPRGYIHDDGIHPQPVLGSPEPACTTVVRDPVLLAAEYDSYANITTLRNNIDQVVLDNYYTSPGQPSGLNLWNWVRYTDAIGTSTPPVLFLAQHPFRRTGNPVLDDKLWFQFREFYLGARYRLLMQHRAANYSLACEEAIFAPTATAPRLRRFVTPATAVPGAPVGSTAAGDWKTYFSGSETTPATACQRFCNANTGQWLSTYADCLQPLYALADSLNHDPDPYNDLDLETIEDSLTARLTRVCLSGCGQPGNLFGANADTALNTSFEHILVQAQLDAGVPADSIRPLACSNYHNALPPPPGHDPFGSATGPGPADECTCPTLLGLYDQYKGLSFVQRQEYLINRLGYDSLGPQVATANLPIDLYLQAELYWPALPYRTLREMYCACTKALVTETPPVLPRMPLPPTLRCSACVTCTRLSQAQEAFADWAEAGYTVESTTFYPDTTDQEDPGYRRVYKNYLNTYLKVNLQYADYVGLRAACQSWDPEDPEPQRCGSSLFTYPITPPCPCLALADLRTFNNDYLRRQAREQVRRRFVAGYTAYMQTTLAAAEKLTATEKPLPTPQPPKHYQWTLYYYDQAGNLVRTLPPEAICQDSLHAFAPGRSQWHQNAALATTYTYNSLNQPTRHTSPDGDTTRYWYDRLGRIVLSQDARQRAGSTPDTLLLSYVHYDHLNRITQVGQIHLPDTIHPSDPIVIHNNARRNTHARLLQALHSPPHLTPFLYEDLSSIPIGQYLAGKPAFTPLLPYYKTRTEVTRLLYDKQQIYTIAPRLGNTRNRLAHSLYYENWDGKALHGYQHATHYSYDVHGNTQQLWRQNTHPALPTEHKIVTFTYQYDLMSGNLHKLSYQPNTAEQYYHSYVYDLDNRLIQARTSRNGVQYRCHAGYQYYLHGPLARQEIGDLQVQGIDHIYTIHGWTKGVNSAVIGDEDAGQDGYNNSPVARDVLAFSLGYYGGDYSAANAAWTSPAPTYNLYNGNIACMSLDLGQFVPAQTRQYRYDQLNRLKEVSVDGQGNTYREQFSYDRNGNILRAKRYDHEGNLLDNLVYNYHRGIGGELLTNKLRHITDSVGYTAFKGDIEDQEADNYLYDKNGSLIRNTQDSIVRIEWRVDRKVSKVVKTDSSQIIFKYDEFGRRISKEVRDTLGNQSITYYVLDAQGVCHSVYEYTKVDTLLPRVDTTVTKGFTGTLFVQKEVGIFGSSRVGLDNVNRVLLNDTVGYVWDDTLDTWVTDTTQIVEDTIVENVYVYTRGKVFYELTNHLGNVAVVVNDHKVAVSLDDSTADHYLASVVSASDYYAFGGGMPGRSFHLSNYRYSFNGMERDDEYAGTNAIYYTQWRPYDARTGRWFSVDRLETKFPWWTPYQFAGNIPTRFVDIDGLEPAEPGKPGSAETAPDRSTNSNTEYAWDWDPDRSQWVKGMEVVTINTEPAPAQDLRYGWKDVFESRGELIATHILSRSGPPQWQDPVSQYTRTQVVNLARELYAKSSGSLGNVARSQDESNIPNQYLNDALIDLVFQSSGYKSNTYYAPQSGAIEPVYMELDIITLGSGISLAKAGISVGLRQVLRRGAGNVQGGANVVYQGIDKATGAVKYVGITERAPAIRFGEHISSGTVKSLLDYRVVPGATNLSRLDARIIEQKLINQHGLNNLLNIRNSIAPKYWFKYGIKQ